MQRKISFAPEEYYHVYNRGTDKRQIFLDDGDLRRFTSLLLISNATNKYHLSDYKSTLRRDFFATDFGERLVHIGVYCLMPNHFHLLIREKTVGGISLFMRKLLTGYSMYFNKKYDRTGALFQGEFKAEHVDNDEYLKYLFAYIHLNPIGIIDNEWKNKKISDAEAVKDHLNTYKFSSLHDFTGSRRPESVILNKEVFPAYYETVSDFNEMINEWVNSSKGDSVSEKLK